MGQTEGKGMGDKGRYQRRARSRERDEDLPAETRRENVVPERNPILFIAAKERTAHDIKFLLQDNGLSCRLLQGGDADTAVRIAEQILPSMVLVDAALDGRCGIEVAEQMLSSEATRDIPIVFVRDVRDDLSSRLEAIRLGVVDYFMLTPFNDQELLARIRSQLRIKALHDALKDKNRQLEVANKTIEDQMRMISSAREKLFEAWKLATLGKMAAGVAHEINNPITTIINYITMFLEDTNNTDPVWRESLELALSEASRIGDITTHLLDFVRRSKEVRRPVTPERIVSDSLALVKYHALFQGISVSKNIAPNLPRVSADPNQIRQVLLALYTNAAQAMDGKGTLTVNVAMSDDAGHVVFDVIDNGCGIDKEHLTSIFLPFFTTKDIGKGTGLGLSVCHEIVVDKHDGEILVDSEVGKGSRFTVKLKVAKDDSDGASDELSAEP
jgi:signal transduction histidine kinase